MTAPIRVMLADDDALVRRGIASIISSDPHITVVAEAADGQQACDMVRSHRADVLLLDIRMPVMDGLSALPHIRQIKPELAVVILTTFGEGEYVTQALAESCSGFLLKTASSQELILGVQAAAAGGASFSPHIAKWIVSRYGPDPVDRRVAAQRKIAQLTPRQREVLTVLGTGASNAEIGRQLHLSEGTVKGYVSDLLDRIEARNRVDAAITAYEAGLLE